MKILVPADCLKDASSAHQLYSILKRCSFTDAKKIFGFIDSFQQLNERMMAYYFELEDLDEKNSTRTEFLRTQILELEAAKTILTNSMRGFEINYYREQRDLHWIRSKRKTKVYN